MLIEEIRVQGYKSLVDATLHVRPLTLLAGTNSSGKSSIMQPLLLIKQTMEANYNPAGALILNGAHVQADTAGELLSILTSEDQFSLKISGEKILGDTVNQGVFEVGYKKVGPDFELEYQRTIHANEPAREMTLLMGQESIAELLASTVSRMGIPPDKAHRIHARVINKNGFLRLAPFLDNDTEQSLGTHYFTGAVEDEIERLMHVPGLRGKAQRSYNATYFDHRVKGTFDLYAAGTVSQWQEQGNTEALTQLNDSLRRLGLTDTVTAKVKNANEVELSVSRLPAGRKGKPRKVDMVNIADVGIGVSQVLPIVVALIAAQEGQLVYVEQPELHLHPRAQVVMAELLAEAANRGVRVIVETHSSLLLLTVQTMVAEGDLKPDDVGLHWFSRDAKGATTVRFEQPDENGAYGDWPEDFGDVELDAKRRYLDAIGQRRAQRQASKAKAQ
jgi:hypothetical protein